MLECILDELEADDRDAGTDFVHLSRSRPSLRVWYERRVPGRRLVVGVMGRGDDAAADDTRLAEELGERIALQNWVLLTGGRDAGVMAAANRGAKRVAGSF